MYVPDIEFHEVSTLEEASALLRRYQANARLLAGGTDLLVDLKTGRVSAEHVISLTRIAEMRGISASADGLNIAALTTISEIARSPLVREGYAPLLDAALQMAAQQVRNMATIGGNIASAVPCADLPPILMTLNASCVLWSSAGQRSVALHTFFNGPRQTVLGAGEILKTIVVPTLPPGFGAAYARLSARNGNGIAVASVAAGLQLDRDGTISDARLVLGAVAPIPKPVASAASILTGHVPDQDLFAKASRAAGEAAEPISDVRGSADYRREVVAVLARRALQRARDRAQENSS